MLSVYRYFQAKKHLALQEETIRLYNKEISTGTMNDMLEAQRDMIKYEVSYYEQQLPSSLFKTIVVFIVCILLFFYWRF